MAFAVATGVFGSTMAVAAHAPLPFPSGVSDYPQNVANKSGVCRQKQFDGFGCTDNRKTVSCFDDKASARAKTSDWMNFTLLGNDAVACAQANKDGVSNNDALLYVLAVAAYEAGDGDRLKTLKGVYDASMKEHMPGAGDALAPIEIFYPDGAEARSSNLVKAMHEETGRCLLIKAAALAGPNWADPGRAQAIADTCPGVAVVPPASRTLVVMLQAAKLSGEGKVQMKLRTLWQTGQTGAMKAR